MKDRKLVFIVHNLGFGGAQKMLVYVAEACLPHYRTIKLLALSDKNTELTIDSRIYIDKLNYVLYENKIKKIGEKMKTIKGIRQYLKKEQPDAVCIFGLDTFLLARIALIGLTTRIIVSERNAPTSYGKIWYQFSKWLYQKSDSIVFQLEDVKKLYNQRIRKKSYVIPNPYRENGVSCFEGERKKIITAAAAKFDHRKGIDTLIRAFAIVHEKHPEYRLIVYGDGPLKDTYVTLVRKLNLVENVSFPGSVSNVAEKINDSSAFVLPSRNEGIPNVLMEAMGTGVPCVACDCIPGGPRLLMNSGERGILVPVDDIKTMADAMIQIIENPKLQKELSTKGQEIKDIFSDKKIKRMWIHVFENLLD